jgi:RNA polymerase sigma-70 factor (ECF subfamily)
MAELPESKRTVMKMIYEEDVDNQAAAEELGIPVGTVKSRLHHARRCLAEMWKELDGEWEDI